MTYKVSLFRDDDNKHVNHVKNKLSHRDKEIAGNVNSSNITKKQYKIGRETPKPNLKLNLKYN